MARSMRGTADGYGGVGERGRHARWRALAPVLVAVVGIVASIQLPLGSFARPGAGLWPLVVSLGLLACGGWLLVSGRSDGDESLPLGTVVRTSIGVASLAAFVVLFQLLGLIVPGIALLLFWLRYMGQVPWRLTLPIAVVAPVLLHVVFVELLAVPFPPDVVLLFRG